MRPVLYRASTVEIIVPYGDPRECHITLCLAPCTDTHSSWHCTLVNVLLSVGPGMILRCERYCLSGRRALQPQVRF